MGIHNTKENHLLKSSMNENQSRQLDNRLKAIESQKLVYYGWQEVIRCSHAEWLCSVSGKRICLLIFFSYKFELI